MMQISPFGNTTIVNGQFALENETINSTPFGNTVLRKQHI